MNKLNKVFLKFFLLCIIGLAMNFNLMAQNAIQVTGIVSDSEGMPIPGATVKEKDTENGTISSPEGKYSIKASSKGTLVITFVGMKTVEAPVNGRTSINVTLTEETIGVDEVVVVGYGVQKKESLTGSIAVVEQAKLENRPVSNALNVLQGTAPGLIVSRTSGEPGNEGWNMNIRGFSSLNGTNQPLVIIDGVEGKLENVNPNDIESVSVLKDASAAAIYGAKSSGGVVIVTTKKPLNKLNINYSGLYTVRVPYGIPGRVHTYDWARMANEANINAGTNPTYTDEQLEWYRKDTVVMASEDLSSIGFYYNINNRELLLRTSTPSQNHNISINGGNERTQFMFSAGYLDQSGMMKFGPDDNSRLNFRLNLNTKLSKILSLDSRIAYANSKVKSPEKSTTARWGILHTMLALGNPGPMGTRPPYLPGYEGLYYLDQGTDHPYAYLKDGGYTHNNEYDFSGVFTLKADLMKGLIARVIYSPMMGQQNREVFRRTIPMYTFTSEGQPKLVRKLNDPNRITKQRGTQLSQELQGLIDYDFTIGQKNNFHLLGGYQYQSYQYDYISAALDALLSNDKPSLNFGTNPKVIPSISDNIQENAWLSIFGKFNYNYNEKYYLDFVVRNDASSRLAPGYRDQTFPSVSAAWRISKEGFFASLFPFVNEFKARASWGKLGNAQLGSNNQNNYSYAAQLTEGAAYPFNSVRNPSIYQGQLPSSSLGWEIVESTNFGLDLSLFKYRLNAGVDYFTRTNDNMLIVINQPSTLGVTPSTMNGAAMKTWGWEATLGWRDKVGSVKYSIDLNFDDNKNEITRYEGNVSYLSGINKAIPGLPINSIFGYEANGYFSTAEEVAEHAFQNSATGPGDIIYVDQNDDKKISGGSNTKEDHGDLVYLGNLSPRYNFGVRLSAEWKGIDFAIFFNGTGKRNILIDNNIRMPYVVAYNAPWSIHQDYWTPDNTDAKFPRLYTGSGHNLDNSSFWVQDAAYIRLKNLQVGYTIPKGWTSKVKIEKARIFFSGQDLWEVNKMWFNVFDAEYPNNAGYTYPFFRSYAMGVNLTF